MIVAMVMKVNNGDSNDCDGNDGVDGMNKSDPIKSQIIDMILSIVCINH